MTLSLRRVALLFALCSGLVSGPALHAQDGAIRITGSAIIEPLLQAMIQAAGVDDSLTTETTGSRTGLARLCAGDSGMSSSTRAIGDELARACEENDVPLVEFTLGHNILAVIAHPDTAEYAACLNQEQLADIFAPSASGNVTRWDQVHSDAPQEAGLTVHVPPEMTATYSLLDALVSGDGLRDDALVTMDAGEAVSATPGSIAVTTLEQAQGHHVLALDAMTGDGCQAPSAASVEDGLYPASAPLLLYASTALLNEPGASELLDLAGSEDAAELVRSAGFTPPTEAIRRENQERLQAAQRGEAPPLVAGEFSLPENLGGALRIGGSGDSYSFVNTTLEALRAGNPGLASTITHQGAAPGLRELCAGALDLVFAGRTLNAEERESCADSNIVSESLALGSQALVLLANEDGAAPACLSTGQLGKIWRAEASGLLTRWSDLDESLADEDMVLFAPGPGDQVTDQLLAAAAPGLIGRIDIELDDDPLYRAAATANVPGALTYMTWTEYERVLANGQERIRLVALNDGGGCVAPAPDSIRDGSWPLAREIILTANQTRLNLPQVQSFLWYLAGEENLPTWHDAGFVGIRPGNLVTLQARFGAAFDAATIAAMARMNEAPAEEESEETADAAG